ncbi:MAG: hypothetical protein ACI9LM_003321 [Alteromonadaceae bacterium]|jgi:hypothetical protein
MKRLLYILVLGTALVTVGVQYMVIQKQEKEFK